jgi:putative transposon-encoded protein
MRKAITREINTEVTLSGNGAHVFVPKGWFGKKVRVTLLNEPAAAIKERGGNIRRINLEKNGVRDYARKVIKNNREVFDRLSNL